MIFLSTFCTSTSVKDYVSMHICGTLSVHQPSSQCVSEQSCYGVYVSRANEKARMDLICTGINSIKVYLHW